MQVSPATLAALERISARAADVRMAFTPGAFPMHDDVARARPGSVPVNDPLSVVAPDGEYFVTTDERGRTLYTRDGGFNVDSGVLRGESGAAVLGFTAPGSGIAALTLDPVDVALGRARATTIERDGRVVYARRVIDPRTGAPMEQRVVVGRIALARFAAGTALVPTDANHFLAPPGNVPHIGEPGDAHHRRLDLGRREQAGVDIDRALARLKDAYLAFDALAAGQTAQWGLGKTAMDLVK